MPLNDYSFNNDNTQEELGELVPNSFLKFQLTTTVNFFICIEN